MRGLYTRILLVFCLSLFLVSNSHLVEAIGISPGSTDIEYVSGLVVDVPFTARADSNSASMVSIELEESPLNQFLVLSSTTAEFDSGGNAHFSVKVMLPEEDKMLVGPVSSRVRVVEISENEGMLVVRTGVKSRITVKFPYPGKFIEFETINAQNVNEGENSNFNVVLRSRGKEGVFFTMKIEILDKNNESLFNNNYQGSIVPGDKFEAKGVIQSARYVPGRYELKATLFYENETKEARSFFMVGTQDIELVSYTDRIKKDGIQSFTAKIRNLWNGDFKNVYGIITIGNMNSQTPSKNMKDFEELELSQYVDTSRVSEGNNQGTLTVHFGEFSKSFPIEVEFYVDSEIVEETPRVSGLVIVAGVIGGLLIILLIIMIFLIKKKK